MTEDIKKILIIAGDFVEDYEIMVPYQVLEIHEYKVEVACPGKKIGDIIKTVIHEIDENYQTLKESLGHNFYINKNFEEVNQDEYIALYLPRGRSPEYLQYNQNVINLIKYFIENEKPICSVCHGPLLLLKTKMMEGKKISGVDLIKNDCELYGAIFCEDEICVDGKIVTGKTYMSHVPLLKEFIQMISE